MHPRFSPAVTRHEANVSLASAKDIAGAASVASVRSTESVGTAELQSAALLFGLAEGRWNEVLRMAGMPEQQLLAMEHTANSHWQK